MPSEIQACIDRLKPFDEKFSTLLALAGKAQRLLGDEAEHAQELLDDLKTSLESACKDLQQRHDKLPHHEFSCVRPALTEAKAKLRINRGSVPGKAWVSNLYDAHGNVTYYLHQLEKALEEEKKKQEKR